MSLLLVLCLASYAATPDVDAVLAKAAKQTGAARTQTLERAASMEPEDLEVLSALADAYTTSGDAAAATATVLDIDRLLLSEKSLLYPVVDGHVQWANAWELIAQPPELEVAAAIDRKDWNRWGISEAMALWVITPNGGPATRAEIRGVAMSTYGECGGFHGILLDIGPQPVGSVVYRGVPPDSWRVGFSPVFVAPWVADVRKRLDARAQLLGSTTVSLVSRDDIAFARTVHTRAEREGGWGYEKVLIDRVFRGGIETIVFRHQQNGWNDPGQPVWLFDADGNGELDVVLTGCANEIWTLDGQLLSSAANTCCGC